MNNNRRRNFRPRSQKNSFRRSPKRMWGEKRLITTIQQTFKGAWKKSSTKQSAKPVRSIKRANGCR